MPPTDIIPKSTIDKMKRLRVIRLGKFNDRRSIGPGPVEWLVELAAVVLDGDDIERQFPKM